MDSLIHLPDINVKIFSWHKKNKKILKQKKQKKQKKQRNLKIIEEIIENNYFEINNMFNTIFYKLRENNINILNCFDIYDNKKIKNRKENLRHVVFDLENFINENNINIIDFYINKNFSFNDLYKNINDSINTKDIPNLANNIEVYYIEIIELINTLENTINEKNELLLKNEIHIKKCISITENKNIILFELWFNIFQKINNIKQLQFHTYINHEETQRLFLIKHCIELAKLEKMLDEALAFDLTV